MVSIKFIFNFKDEKALLAEDVVNEMHRDSRMHVDKIGPGSVIFEKTVKKYKIKTFPVIIVAGSGQLRKIKIEGDKYFKDKEILKNAISDTFIKV